MQLTEDDIREINNNSPSSEQGIYIQPYGVPVDVKTHVIYKRWVIGGIAGGSCWGTEHHSRKPEQEPKWKVLNAVLKKLKPDISFLQFREIEDLIKTNQERDREYYGNSTDYMINYIVLDDLYKLLETF